MPYTNLKSLMDQRGISCRALAKTLGVSPTATSEWTRLVAHPQPIHRRNLSAYFGMPVDWLLASADHKRDAT